MFVLNILLLGIKVILIMVEFIYKNSKLGEAPTSLDKVDGQGRDVELGSAESANGIVYQHNPMMEESRSEDTVPLLRRVDNVEQETKSVRAKTESIEAKTESIEAETKSVRAKTDRMEEKFQLALEEMNKKVEKMANSGNYL